MKYLVDTDWLIDAFIGTPTSVRLLDRLSGNGLAISIISFGEVFEGAFRDLDPSAKLADFRIHLDGFITLPLIDPVMETFARIRAELRREGRLIPDLDLLIASTAIHHDLTC